jgi:flagellar biosynthesis anti-sigma factor FlgM
MKIDPKVPANGQLQSDRVQNTANPAVQSQSRPADASQVQAEDTFQPSGRHAELQRLTAQAASVPEVRTEKVAPLQAKVQRGTYKPDSQKVADALISEQSRSSAKG